MDQVEPMCPSPIRTTNENDRTQDPQYSKTAVHKNRSLKNRSNQKPQ